MPLINKIFYKSYNNIANNKKAVAVRGWYPPNMVLLQHPLLIADENPPPQSSSSHPEINLDVGLAGSVLDKIIRERSKSKGAKKANEKRKLTSNLIAENILKLQRLTSGVMTNNSIHSLSDPRFLEPFCQRCVEAANKDAEKKSKWKAINSKLVSAVKALRVKWGHEKTHFFQQRYKNKCGAYLQYKKQKKDKAMPKDLQEQRQRCVEWITCQSPTTSPYQNDEEDSNDQHLLGMVAAATELLPTEHLEEDGVEGGIDDDDNEYGWEG
jgi:hypothetical protein